MLVGLASSSLIFSLDSLFVGTVRTELKIVYRPHSERLLLLLCCLACHWSWTVSTFDPV